MRAWLVRAGKHGEREQFALDNSCVVVGWKEVDDLAQSGSRDEMVALLRKTYPDAGEKKLLNHGAQLWAFAGRIDVGDLVILPLHSSPALARSGR